MDKLLPCPFCGESKYISVKTTINNCHYFSCLCSSCGASSGYENTVEQAISAWNTRAEQNEPLTLNELKQMDGQAVYCVDTKGRGYHCLGFHNITGDYKIGETVQEEDLEKEPFFALMFQNPKSIENMIKSLTCLRCKMQGDTECALKEC